MREKRMDVEARAHLDHSTGVKWHLSAKGNLVLTGRHRTIVMTPHPNGLTIGGYGPWGKQRVVLPGEVRFDRLVAYLTKEVGIGLLKQRPARKKAFANVDDFIDHDWREERLRVATALRASGIWRRRGTADPEKETPRDFWRKMTIDKMIEYSAWRGPRHAWKEILRDVAPTGFFLHRDIPSKLQEPISQIALKKAMELRVLPDVPWAIRGWKHLDLSSLAKHALAGTIRCKAWAYYASNCQAFDKMLHGHGAFDVPSRVGSPLDEIRGQFLKFLEKWPKTKAGLSSLDEAYNHGMDMIDILEIAPASPRELLECTDIWRQLSDLGRKHLNSTYVPPAASLLKPGWAYVDHTNAHKMSTLYSCCFSTNRGYIDAICEGDAVAIFRPKFGGNDLGALAFIYRGYLTEEGKPTWSVSQIKGFGNEEADTQYQKDATVFARALTITHPEPFPEVEQDPRKQMNFLAALGPHLSRTIGICKDFINEDTMEIAKDRIKKFMIECQARDILGLLTSATGIGINKESLEWQEFPLIRHAATLQNERARAILNPETRADGQEDGLEVARRTYARAM